MVKAAELPQSLQEAAGRWAEVWKCPGLEKRTEISFSSRFRGGLGRAYLKRRRVTLSTRLLNEEREFLEEALCHELAHIAVAELNNQRRRPHGPEWKELMRAVGFEPRTRIPVNGTSTIIRRKRRRRYLYLHRCPVCQSERAARRVVRQWRCVTCVEAGLDGVLEIWRRPARRGWLW